MKISDIKGIGEKTQILFGKLGVYTVEDLIRFYPRDYEEYEKPILINEINDNSVVAIYGVIAMSPELKRFKNIQLLTTVIKDSNNEEIKLKWFNMPYLKNKLIKGEKYIFRGRVNRNGVFHTIDQPEIFTLKQYDLKLSEVQPIYSLTKGLSNKTIQKAVKQIIEAGISINGLASDKISKKYDLMNYKEAVKEIHFPRNIDKLKTARNRLVFDEFYGFLMGIKNMKQKRKQFKSDYNISDHETTNKIIENLGFDLTEAQKNTLFDIRNDFQNKNTMNRLIQGDVGSGKTIIAILALIDVVLSGYQGAFMVPTEVLAIQHFESIKKITSENDLDINPVLLTGSLKVSEKKKIYEKIKSGEADIIIGTHALIQDKVEYNNLAFVITDEQHRFGVRQRNELKNKGKDVNVLVMSATPIPRTLALMIYGDLDISIIDELPSDRLPIKNCLVDLTYRDKSYKFIYDEVKKAHQVYIICPMIEENDLIEAQNVSDYTKSLKEKFGSSIKIEALHGGMTPTLKNDIMERFSKAEIDILVSTTVIEVGINVPNATVMMIENAERFGLATLHQLRGRVGRGKDQSYCIFITASKNENTLKKLEIINKSNDGFYIANEDLKTRGQGDVFGVRQSGEILFKLGDIYSDSRILKWAKEAVELNI